MMLLRLELQAFGCFVDEAIDFAPGMNLVSGPNESGKSTLAQAVPSVLFGAPDVARIMPWERPGMCRAAVVLTSGERRIRVTRDFVSGKVQWFEGTLDSELQQKFCGFPEAADAVADRAAYLACLRDGLGLCQREFLEAMLYRDTFNGVGGLPTDHLEICLSDGGAGAMQERLKDLQAEYLALSSANPWGLPCAGDGQLEVIARQLGELEQEWFALQDTIRGLQNSEAAREGGETVSDQEIVTQGEVATDCSRSAEAFSQTAATPLLAEHGVQGDLNDQRAALEAELAKTGLPRHMPCELSELLIAHGELRQAMAEQKRALGARQEERRRCRMPSRKGPGIQLAGVWAAALFWARLQSGWMAAGSGLLATAAVVGWHLRKCLQVREAGRQSDRQIDALEQGVGELQEQLNVLNERLEQLGFALSPVDMVRLQKNLPRHQQLLEQLRSLDTAPAVTGHPDAVSSGPAETHGTGDACLASGAAISGTVSAEACPQQSEDPPSAQQNPSGLDELLDARSRIEARGEALRLRETQLKQRRETLRTACDQLREALAEPTSVDRDAFASLLARLLSGLTGGAIEQVRVTEDYQLQLPGPNGNWLSQERFGSATRMLLQLASCMALNGLRDEPLRLPLLLDEPLGNLDKKRRGQALKVLEQYTAGQQVILFSHDEGLRRRAMREGWHLLSLGGEGLKVAAGGEEKHNDGGQLSFL